jgi:transcriptional regulator with XRE-family HTH domain
MARRKEKPLNLKLLLALRSRGLRGAELAERAGVAQSTVSRDLNCIHTVPKARAGKYAKVLRCRIADLFDETQLR